ncbi:MAG: nitrogen fixation protein NifX [Rhodospirillaceae bacterium]
MTARRLRLVDDEYGLDRTPVEGGRMKVALATNDMKTVNGHFNGAKNMAVYEVGRDGYEFIEVIQFDDLSKQDGKHTEDGEDRLNNKVKALTGVALLFVKAIGGPAAAKVVRNDIHPIKLPTDEPMTSVLDRVQTMLNGNPPPWLRKIMLRDEKVAAAAGGAHAFLDDDEDDYEEESA